MALIEIPIERSFHAPGFAAAWSVLRDARETLSHYPRLKRLTDLGDDTWRWEMEPMGASGFRHQVVYAVVYRYDEPAGEILWDPIEGEGNAQVSGAFRLRPVGDIGGVRVTFSTQCNLEIPAPRMLKSLIGPFARREFNGQIDCFIANLEQAIGRR